jgi:phosphoribosylamine--glycine ligase
MKFFMMSKCGEGCGLLERIQSEGNSVRIYIGEREYYSIYEGIFDREETCNPVDGEIVIFDSSYDGKFADKYRKKGLKVFGGGEFHDKLEKSRGFGLRFMQESGIKIPRTFIFKKDEFQKAYDFINRSGIERFAFKPSGDLPSRLTYCACDKEDLLSYMQWVHKNFGQCIKDFCLQEFINGPIVSSEFWCGPHGFIRPGNQTVEVKKFMNDDLGQSTGCQGNLVWRCDDSKVLERGILRAEQKLIENQYIGPIDLNSIIAEDGVYGLEWTPRFGLDAMPTLLQILKVDVGKLISDIVNGQTKEMSLSENFGAGVRLSIPPYPLEPLKLSGVAEVSPNYGIPIHLPEKYESNYYLYEVMVDKEKQLVHSKGTGIIGVVSCSSSDCVKAFEDCYDILDEVKVPDKQYRTDLGEVIPEMYEELKEAELCLV